jgi:hypothetical protein
VTQREIQGAKGAFIAELAEWRRDGRTCNYDGPA